MGCPFAIDRYNCAPEHLPSSDGPMTPPPVAEPAAPYERDPELCDEIIAEWRKDWAGRLGKQPDGSILWRVNASDIMRLVERIDAQAATLSAEIAARVKAEGERDEALRPFARVGDTIGLYDADGEPLPYIVMPIMQDGALLKMHVSIDPADFCRARTLLAGGQPKP